MQDTLIIDTSNAPCGPGFLPGLRLSEGRFAINRKRPRFRGWGSRRRLFGAFVPLSADCCRDAARCRCGGPAGSASTLPKVSVPLSPSFPSGGGAPRRARMSRARLPVDLVSPRCPRYACVGPGGVSSSGGLRRLAIGVRCGVRQVPLAAAGLPARTRAP